MEQTYGNSDPLAFVQGQCADFGLDLKNSAISYNEIASGEDITSNPSICHFGEFSGSKVTPDGSLMEETLISFEIIAHYTTKEDSDRTIHIYTSKKLDDFISGNKRVNGKRLEEFDPRKESFEVLGDLKKDLELEIYMSHWRPKTHYEDCYFINIAPNSNERCVVSISSNVNSSSRKAAPNIFRGINGLLKQDFRPYIARVFEAWCLPEEDWQDPSFYLNENKDVEKFLDTTVETFFTGEERQRIERQINDARLKMRGTWLSIPRLNLGAIKLPTPGQRDITTDQFVVEAVPYVVEYLSTLGIMSHEEAERTLSQKLTNYFFHNTGFQLSRDRAKSIVDSLKSKNKKTARGVA